MVEGAHQQQPSSAIVPPATHVVVQLADRSKLGGVKCLVRLDFYEPLLMLFQCDCSRVILDGHGHASAFHAITRVAAEAYASIHSGRALVGRTHAADWACPSLSHKRSERDPTHGRLKDTSDACMGVLKHMKSAADGLAAQLCNELVMLL